VIWANKTPEWKEATERLSMPVSSPIRVFVSDRLEDGMASRTSSRQVIFGRPFWISGLDCRQSAGTYTVDTEEKLNEARSFPAWEHIATVMRIPKHGVTEYLRVNRDELDDALARDAQQLDKARAERPDDSVFTAR
jgi:hypothetical protein